MGNSDSKSTPSPIGDDERGIRMYCRMDESMVSTAVVPDYIAERYSLKFEKYICMMDSDKEVYCCEVSQVDGKINLTTGWGEFVRRIGATVGDFMVFDIRGLDETFVWVFAGDGNRNVCVGSRSSVAAAAAGSPGGGTPSHGMQQVNGGAQSSGGGDTVRVGREPGRVFVSPGDNEIGKGKRKVENDSFGGSLSVGHSSSGTSESSSTSKDTYTTEESGEDMSTVLEMWRTKLVVGKNIELDDYMVSFIAAGMDWELPEFAIYVGKVEATSIANNRMRLPRMFTAENVMLFLRGKNTTFYMETENEGDRPLKFSIAKDGRAALTEGWADFAASNGIRPGSLLAFSFNNKKTELDIEIDLLRK